MSKFHINEYKGKFAMHCKTEEEAKDFCAYLHSVGRKWCDGESYLNRTRYKWCGTNTVYYFNENIYGGIDYAIRNNYIILEWSDFMEKKFTKADLKTGDVVKRRDGSIEIVNRELEMLICKSGWNNLDNIKEDLTYGNFPSGDIVAVRRPRQKSHCNFGAFANNWGTLVYEREDPVEMTLAEICKALGKEIKIVKEH